MNRTGVLRNAELAVNGPRADDYGDADENFARIAALWTAQFGYPFTSGQVAQAMILVKTARLHATPDHVDTWTDIAGYAALGGEVS